VRLATAWPTTSGCDMSLSNQVEELELELYEATQRAREAEERVDTLEKEVERVGELADELQEQIDSFVAYVEQIAPGAHNAWLIANKLEA
jgi:predicted  nucleic acid-binding Zn-ribbon protein